MNRLSGLTGVSASADAGQLAFIVVAEADPERPDLKVRLIGRDGSILHVLDLVEVRARGLEGPGFWISGTDRSGRAQFQFLLNGADQCEVFRLNVSSPDGKTPTEGLRPLRAAVLPQDASSVVVDEDGVQSPAVTYLSRRCRGHAAASSMPRATARSRRHSPKTGSRSV